MKTYKKLFLLLLLGAMSTTLMAQRHTDKLDRGLVAVPTNSGNFVSWRRLTNEYYDVTYNLYRGSVKVASNLTKTSYRDTGGNSSSTYQIEPVLSGKPGEKCDAVSLWKSYYYKYAYDTYNGYIDIALSPVYDRDKNDVTSHYEPNDAEMADLDGDGQLEMIIKRLNTRHSTLEITRKTFFYGILTGLPFLLCQETFTPLSTLLEPEIAGHMLFLSLVCSMLAFFLWGRVTKGIGAISSSTYLYLDPIVSLIAAAIVLDERVGLVGLAGCALILLGIIIVERHHLHHD
jgi:hypothetical protein